MTFFGNFGHFGLKIEPLGFSNFTQNHHTHTKKHLKHFCHFFTRALRPMDGPTEGPMVGPMVGPTDGLTKSLKWSLVCH